MNPSIISWLMGYAAGAKENKILDIGGIDKRGENVIKYRGKHPKENILSAITPGAAGH